MWPNGLSSFDSMYGLTMWPMSRFGRFTSHAEFKRDKEQEREHRRLSNGHGGFNRQVFAKVAK